MGVVMSIETLVLAFSYSAIFVFMVTNGIVSLPSSQFIYITAGFFVPSGELSFLWVAVSGTLGNTMGNTILYELSRRKGIKYVTNWKSFSEERIEKITRAFEKKGWVIILVGKFLPLVKVVVPVVAGIAHMDRTLYTLIIVFSSFLWAVGLTYFGFYFGRNYQAGNFGLYSFILIGIACVAIYMFGKYVESMTTE